ncbi:TPA: hypothetical protein KOX39_003399 [Clostridioides difficile]|nr:hypothetical protein [Clostridioides difficile]
MAIIKENNINQFGVQEEYYRILNINLNLQYKYCDITVGGYVSREIRMSESEPMNIRKVRAKWSDDEFLKFFTADALEEQSIYRVAYEYVMEDDYFKDCIEG